VLEKNKAGLRLYKTKATFTSVEVGAHDRAKKRRLAMPGLVDELVGAARRSTRLAQSSPLRRPF